MGSLTTEGQGLAEKCPNDPRVEGKLSQAWKETPRKFMASERDGGKAEFAFRSVQRLHNESIYIIG